MVYVCICFERIRMKMIVETKRNEMVNSKKRKELFEVYEWSSVIGELYESLCCMIDDDTKEGREWKWFVVREYCM